MVDAIEGTKMYTFAYWRIHEAISHQQMPCAGQRIPREPRRGHRQAGPRRTPHRHHPAMKGSCSACPSRGARPARGRERTCPQGSSGAEGARGWRAGRRRRGLGRIRLHSGRRRDVRCRRGGLAARAVRLLDHVRYIRQERPDKVRRMAGRTRQLAEDAAEMPDAGWVVPEFNNPAIRERIIRPYRFVYLMEEERIVVLEVVHGRRLMPERFDD